MKNTLERLDLLVGWGMPWDSLGGPGESGSESMGYPQCPDKGKKDRYTELKMQVSTLTLLRREKRVNL